jgi:3',5'-nucleoside bisphosphate phosphatase
MSPAVIVKTLQEKHIQLAALTDHNTALNCPAFAKCCRDAGIAALYGMEAQTSEELHVLCLFPVLRTAIDFCAAWYDSLPDIRNKPEITGDQVYVDENDEIVGEVEKYLITSAPWTLDECAAMVHQSGGLVIPAHVDRPSFSMMSQLGTIVEGSWDALEFVRPQVLQNERQAVSALEIKLPAPYPVITSSDAHYVEHIGRRAFDLDIGDMPLVNSDGTVNIPAVLSGLAKRVVQP